MTNKVKQYIDNYKMLEKGDQIIVGVSGGADSVCLFHVLLELQREYELTLYVIHVNHGIRGEEALRDEEYVRELCRKEKASFTAVYKDIPLLAKEGGMSLEEAGRKARYEVFNQYLIAYKCNKVAIAHNKNDNAETVLFHMFRGSALRGLTGISPVRDKIIRPLLCLERWEIEAYLQERGIPYLNDSTNFTMDYSRNKIRLGILKEAEAVNKKAVSHIAKAAQSLTEIKEFIEKSTQKAEERILIKKEKTCILLKAEELAAEDVVIQKEVVRKAFYLLSESLKDVESLHVAAVLNLLDKQAGKRINLPYGITAVREYHHIELTLGKKGMEEVTGAGEAVQERELMIPGITPLFEKGKILTASLLNYKKNMIIPQSICTKWFDYDKIKDTVLIRSRKQGDYLCIDEKGGTKKLKAFFIDEKIPRQERDILPLLADGPHIMWIIGSRISEAYKVDENTKRILQIKLTEEEQNE
ncbi:tRNA lysidine(34) synthetase TilS [Anaerocolumna xylanovorans]|uniref:tRNA(Ile)-lysidine synthase n=1 Tax=Anaerocolumna xylanovorans DSM 12503 TaxID=1121345 RepID=A0A1M7Y6N0_9FIRM|nr:tRNA lysidine(34) synthetase TilS [Anaerocolumna xylanovorans]SHO48254.1 tRNA(Ile)-lysidine synthase [Anaerocolumna xylanovorans DSM 12503]